MLLLLCIPVHAGLRCAASGGVDVVCPGQAQTGPRPAGVPGLRDLLGALSEALSLVGDQRRGHHQRHGRRPAADRGRRHRRHHDPVRSGRGRRPPRRAGAISGHSVGEITAAAAAGVLSAQDAMTFVALRGRGMAQASAATPTGMSAVLVVTRSRCSRPSPPRRPDPGQQQRRRPDRGRRDSRPDSGPRRRPADQGPGHPQVAGASHRAHGPGRRGPGWRPPSGDPPRQRAGRLQPRRCRRRRCSAEVLSRLVSQVSNPSAGTCAWNACPNSASPA